MHHHKAGSHSYYRHSLFEGVSITTMHSRGSMAYSLYCKKPLCRQLLFLQLYAPAHISDFVLKLTKFEANWVVDYM